jgi:ribosomal protein S18 acetylase RimI-like enzyme
MAVAPSRVPDAVLLSNVVFDALSGRHARFAESEGRVLRYVDAVAPFAALPPAATEQDWHDLATLAHRTGTVALHRVPGDVRDGWAAEHNLDVHAMSVFLFAGNGLTADADDPEVVALTAEDVPDMLDLTARTEPGPFRDRTIELGGYVGIRRDGVLAAMAGQRFSSAAPDGRGWTEVSAVCTDPAFRGQGLATRLIRAVAAGIRARGDEVFLHVRDTNTSAIALYEHIGFTRLTPIAVTVLSPRAD